MCRSPGLLDDLEIAARSCRRLR